MLPDYFGSPEDYATAMGRPEEALDPLCDFCARRPAVKDTGDGRPICQTCDENADEAAWVRSHEEAQ